MAQRLGVGSSLFLFGAFMVKKLHHEPQAPRVVDPLFDYISTYTGTGHTNATMAPAGPEIAAVVTAAAVPLIAWGPLATALLLIAAMLLLARVSSLFVTKVTRNFARFARGGLGMVLAGLWFLLPLLYQMYGYYAVIDQFSGLLANFVDLPRTALLLAKLATAAMLTLLPALGDADAPGLLLLRIWKLGKDLDLETAGLREEREINRNLRQELEKAKDYAKRMLKITLKHESVQEDLELRLGEAEKARLSAMRKMNIRKDDAYRQMTTEIVSLKHRLHGAEVKARTVELNRDVILNRDREKAKKDLLAIATKLEETEETSQARLERLNKVTQEVREVRDQLQAAKTGKTKAEEKNERQLDRLEQNKITAAQLNDKLGVAKKAQAAAEVWERRAVTAQEYLKAQLVITKRELERAAETSKVQLKLSKQDAKEADELRAKLRASKEELEMTKKLGQGQLDQLSKDAEQTEEKIKATKKETKEADKWYEGQIALLYETTKKMEKKVRWFRKAKQKAMGDAQKSKQMATKARTVAKRAMGKALKMKQVAKREPEAAKKDLPEEKTCSPAPAAEAENTAGAVTQLPSGTTIDDGAAETDAGGPPASGTPPPLLLPESTPSDDSELPAAAAPEAEPQAIPTMAAASGTPSREVTTTAVDHGAAETGVAASPAPVIKAVLPAVLVPQVARQALPVPVAAVHVGAAVQGSSATAVTSRAVEKAPSAPLVGAAELQRVERLWEIIALKVQQKFCAVTNDMSYRVRSDFAEQRRELAIKVTRLQRSYVETYGQYDFDGEAEAEYQAQVAVRASVSAPESGNGAMGRGESERTSSAAHETAAEVASGKPDLTMSDLPPPSLPQQDPAPPHFGDSVMSGTEEAPVVPGGGETVAGSAAMPAFALPGVALPGLVLPALPPVDQPALIVPRAARAPANLFMPRRTQLRPSRLSIELTRAADEPMHDAPGDETVYDRDGDQAMEEAQGGDAETVEGGDETMPDAHDEEAGDDAAMDTSG